MKREVPKWQLDFAKDMRHEPTKAENLLWQMLRGKKLEGMKFRRQEPLGPYIVDFLCHDHKLIIEADGNQHAQSASDIDRDSYFESQGYRVLRFWNDEIENDCDAVAQKILRETNVI